LDGHSDLAADLGLADWQPLVDVESCCATFGPALGTFGLGQIVLPGGCTVLLLFNLLCLAGLALYLFQAKIRRTAQSGTPVRFGRKGADPGSAAGRHDRRIDLVWSC
jgi:hypothetical protein